LKESVQLQLAVVHVEYLIGILRIRNAVLINSFLLKYFLVLARRSPVLRRRAFLSLNYFEVDLSRYEGQKWPRGSIL
jgi:hypothetical protein